MPKKKTTRSSKNKSKKSRKATRTSSSAANKSTASLSSALKKSSSSSAASVSNVGMRLSANQLTAGFIAWFIGHSAVLYLAHRLYPEAIVLGTHTISPQAGLALSMVAFTLLTIGALPVIETVRDMMGRDLKSRDWMMIYFVLDAAGIWFIARFAEQLGMGISSFMVAIALAIVFDFVQGALMQIVTSTVKS